MSDFKLLLCTDMDRTVIPNGVQSEHSLARVRFAKFCEQSNVKLIYVSGRHLSLVLEAIRLYALPTPDYVISDVGTKIYYRKGEQWLELDSWQREIDKDWRGKSHADLKKLFKGFTVLKLQETSKQNTHKLSYYVPLQQKTQHLLADMEIILKENNIDASLIWSVDDPKGIGLLDVLPEHATKLHAIEFMVKELGYTLDEVVFAGDSGNDLAVMASPIHSVLVANAADDVRASAIKLAQANGHESALYLANGKHGKMNGNYAAGVLEGVWHFVKAARANLADFGFHYD